MPDGDKPSLITPIELPALFISTSEIVDFGSAFDVFHAIESPPPAETDVSAVGATNIITEAGGTIVLWGSSERLGRDEDAVVVFGGEVEVAEVRSSHRASFLTKASVFGPTFPKPVDCGVPVNTRPYEAWSLLTADCVSLP